MKEIIVSEKEVWDFFKNNFDEPYEEEVIIAENWECGVEIYLSKNENGNPVFDVCMDMEVVFSEEAETKEECEDLLRSIYNWYIKDFEYENCGQIDFDEECLLSEEEDAISTREDDLNEAVESFLRTALEEYQYFTDIDMPVIEMCKKVFVEFLVKRFGYNIRHPMTITDTETGESFFTEYPYPYLFPECFPEFNINGYYDDLELEAAL